MTDGVEIPESEWSGYLDAVSRDMEGATLEIEAGSDRPGPEVCADRLALQFVAYLRRDQLFEIAGETNASSVRDVHHHVIDHPLRIAVDVATTRPSRIVVVARDGARTVITLDCPNDR